MARQRRAATDVKARSMAGAAAEEQGVMARYKVEAVSRAVLLLEALRRGPATQTIHALAARTGISEQAVGATLATLERRGLAQRTGGEVGGFSLGLAWLRLADVKRQQLEIREVSLPVMRRMCEAVNETVSLGIRIGTSRVNIEYAESRHEVRRIVQPGFHVALHIGAGGRSLMSGMDDEEIEAYLAPIAMSQIQKSKLVAAIKETRRDGYGVVEGEVTSDTAAVSAPVRNHVGEVLAALTISMPEERFNPAMRNRCIKEVVKGAREISLAMGFDPART